MGNLRLRLFTGSHSELLRAAPGLRAAWRVGASASLSFKLTLLVKGLLHWSLLTVLA